MNLYNPNESNLQVHKKEILNLENLKFLKVQNQDPKLWSFLQNDQL